MEIVIAASSVVFFLIVWFQTEAFVEYGKLIGLGRLLRIDAYLGERKKDFSIASFPEYLARYDTFVTRLLMCPFCIGFWLTLIACFIMGCNVYVTYILSMLIYHVQIILIKYS
jgi:hypothetical protein